MTITFFIETVSSLLRPFRYFFPRLLDLKTNPVPLQNWPVGGRLEHFWRVWAGIGSSRRVVRWLRHGFPLRFDYEVVASRGMPPLMRADPHNTRSVVTVSTRLASKQGQVRTYPVTVNSISRGAAGFGQGHFLPDGGKSESDPHDHQQDPAGMRSAVRGRGVVIGISSIHGADGPVRPFKSPPSATASDPVFEEGPSVRSADPHDGSVSGHAQMVDVVSSAADRITFPPPDTGADGLYRRIARGMGSGISGSFVARKMASHEAPYKLSRNQGSLNSHSTSAVSAPRDERVISLRQYDSGFLSKETGRYQVEIVTETNQECVDVG